MAVLEHLAADPASTLQGLWQLARMPSEALNQVRLTGHDPVLPSSFAVGTAAQSTVAAAALAACELGHMRGMDRQQVSVDMLHAALECVGWFSINGRAPPLFDALSGLYQCLDGWVRLHAVFEHHRYGALRLLGLSMDTTERWQVERAISGWRALELEAVAARAGLVLTALRSFDEWDASDQGKAVSAQPLFSIEKIADAPPLELPPLPGSGKDVLPLHGIRVLDVTRILAGPVAGRTLAGYGADVMLVNAPHLRNIEAIAETSRGKLSTHLDLRNRMGKSRFKELLTGSHVMIQGYRPGGLESLGFGPTKASQVRPGIVYVTLSAYGRDGPWAERRGFDSLVQTAMGFSLAEGQAANPYLGESSNIAVPRALPMQILDHATGFLIALCSSAAIARQQREGGSWHVNVSLAQTGHWLRGLGRVSNGFAVPVSPPDPYLDASDSGFGKLMSIAHSATLSKTPAKWNRPSMPPGTHAPIWPADQVEQQ